MRLGKVADQGERGPEVETSRHARGSKGEGRGQA